MDNSLRQKALDALAAFGNAALSDPETYVEYGAGGHEAVESTIGILRGFIEEPRQYRHPGYQGHDVATAMMLALAHDHPDTYAQVVSGISKTDREANPETVDGLTNLHGFLWTILDDHDYAINHLADPPAIGYQDCFGHHERLVRPADLLAMLEGLAGRMEGGVPTL